MIWDILLNILAIIGIVAVSVVLVFLIARLVIVSTDKNKTRVEFSEEEDDSVRNFDDNYDEEPSNNVGFQEHTVDEVKSWDEVQAGKEREKIASGDASDNLIFEDEQNISKMEKDFNNMDDAFNDDEETDYEVSDEEIERLIDKINAESLAEYREGVRQSSEKENEEVEIEEEAEDEVAEPEDEEVEEEYTIEKANLERERKEIEEAQAQIEEERANLEAQKKQLEEDMKRLEELKNEQSNAVVVSDVASLYSGETLSQLEARLEVLNERLKENKKDLRENKKEYNPLAKVKKTLEKDKAKLTRKEAIVARQKVILYGVNNYVDIDEEKAKKLNEELDLLDGLRLSVQHCEDVMNANKDRFPILEKTNKILKKVNAEILSDIAEVEKAIEEKKKQIA